MRISYGVVKNANLVCRLSWCALVLFATSFSGNLTGCARNKPAAELPAKTVVDFFDVRVGDGLARIQIAVRENEMQRGLMERRNLGPNDGMLFVYEHPQQMSFWMRNTPTPLDIGFFNSSGVLEEIYPLHPFDETPVRSRSRSLAMALEMNQGWYHANGVKRGAKLDLKAVSAALKSRGFTPGKLAVAP